MLTSRGQIMGVDAIVAFVIFTIGLMILSIYLINSQSETGVFETLYYDGELLAKDVLSEGYPVNWDGDNVVKIGILTGEKINQTKLEEFYNLAQKDYSLTKNLFNTQYDYYVTLSATIMVDGEPVDGIGKPGVDISSIDSPNLVKINRVTIYQDKPVNLFVHVWD